MTMLSHIAGILLPSLTRAILKSYLGADLAGAPGSAAVIALKYFEDRQQAKKAESIARDLAKSIISEIEPWILKEIPDGDDIDYYLYEIVDTIDRGFSEKAAIECSLNSELLKSHLIKSKQDDWAISGPESATLMERLISVICEPLSRLVPALPKYTFERDRVVLSSLSEISSRLDEILDGGTTANAVIEKFNTYPENLWKGYEDIYREALIRNLDYVEILGLDLKREDRLAPLSVAYLSLTVEDSSSEDTEALRFETVLTLLPLKGNRLIVEGGAGSGKSTLLRWAAMHFASPKQDKSSISGSFKGLDATTMRFLERSFRNTDTASKSSLESISEFVTLKPLEGRPLDYIFIQAKSISSENLDNLRSILSKFAIPKQNTSKSPWVVPFLIRLRDFQGHKFPDVDSLATTVVDVGQPPHGWVSSVLNEGRAVILIDGVDEVTEERGARASMLAAIRKMSKTFPLNTYIVAGRPGAFTSSPFDVETVLKVTVNDMDDKQRGIFVDRWHTAKAERQPSQETKSRVLANAGKLHRELRQNSALRRMASNPLLAASICALHDLNPTTVPKNEYELCERLAKMLVSERDLTEDENGFRVNLEQLGRAYALDYADKRTVISRLAGQMLQTGGSLLSWPECRAVVAEAIPALNRAERVTADALLAALAIRSGVLRRAIIKVQSFEETSEENEAQEAIEFVHNRFKEWFASIYYRDRQQPTELANRLPDDPFDQIGIFAVSAEGSEAFANTLMAALQARVGKEAQASRKRALKLAAVRINDAARILSPDLRNWATSMHAELFPPSNKTEARALSLLGDTAVPFLKPKGSWDARKASLAAFCLRLIGSEAALALLEQYLGDERWTVGQEAITERNIVRSAALKRRIISGKPITGSVSEKLKSLNGMDLTKAHSIDLSSTKFEDINSLLSASKLAELDISNTSISNIDGIGKLTELRKLIANGIRLDSFFPISTLNLNELGLFGSNIADLTDIGSQNQLKWLNIGFTRIKDLEYLSLFPQLLTLIMSSINVENMDPIASLENLTHLYLDDIKSIDLLFLQNLNKITTLFLIGSKILGIEFLDHAVTLTKLNLSFSSFDNIQYVLGLSKLNSLNMDGCKVKSLDGIDRLQLLTRIDMDGTLVQDISPLTKLPKLKSIFAKGNIKDYSPLLNCPSLRYLGVSNDAVIDVDAFKNRKVTVVRGYLVR